MRLFDWLFRRNSKTKYIPKEEFVEDLKEVDESNIQSLNKNDMDFNSNNESIDHDENLKGRELIDNFLLKDYEQQGYDDALVNSDSSYAESSKKILKSQLEIKIDKALTYYRNKIKDYDFHIKTRGENGMQDTVAEIEAEKTKILEEIENIETILKEAKENKGKGHIIILSYEKGFNRGLAAITASKLF